MGVRNAKWCAKITLIEIPYKTGDKYLWIEKNSIAGLHLSLASFVLYFEPFNADLKSVHCLYGLLCRRCIVITYKSCEEIIFQYFPFPTPPLNKNATLFRTARSNRSCSLYKYIYIYIDINMVAVFCFK